MLSDEHIKRLEKRYGEMEESEKRIAERDKRIVELERKSDQDDETIVWQAQKISQHIDRIAELEQQLAARVPEIEYEALIAAARNPRLTVSQMNAVSIALDKFERDEIGFNGLVSEIVGIAFEEFAAMLSAAPAQPEQPTAQPIGDEWAPCMKKPVVVHVRQQRPGESHISTREGLTPVKPDDLIMRGIEGEEYPIGREIFDRTYTMEIEQPAAHGEPVAWHYTVKDKVHLETHQLDHYHVANGEYVKGRPLVFADEGQQASKPMTLEEEEQGWVDECDIGGINGKIAFRQGVRFAERFHKIGEQK